MSWLGPCMTILLTTILLNVVREATLSASTLSTHWCVLCYLSFISTQSNQHSHVTSPLSGSKAGACLNGFPCALCAAMPLPKHIGGVCEECWRCRIYVHTKIYVSVQSKPQPNSKLYYEAMVRSRNCYLTVKGKHIRDKCRRETKKQGPYISILIMKWNKESKQNKNRKHALRQYTHEATQFQNKSPKSWHKNTGTCSTNGSARTNSLW